MSTFRYVATDLISGELLADSIPLNVQMFSQQINGGGTLTGSLDLSQDYQANAPYLTALAARRAVIWVLANETPVWNGVVWDWPDMSRASGTLPVSAQTMDSVFTHRLITADLEYSGVDMFEVFLDLVNYGTSKTSQHIASTSPYQGPASPLVAAAAAVAGLGPSPAAQQSSGQPWTASYPYSDLGQVASAFSDMVSAGLEYAFVPGLTQSGELMTGIYLGLDTGLGRSFDECQYSLAYPGNASDYGLPVTGSQSANYLWGTAPPAGSAAQWESQYPHGVDEADMVAGYPLMEASVQWQGSNVTAQSQVDDFADGQMALQTQGMTQPVITVPDGVTPLITDITLGDIFQFAATSPLHPPGPNGEPGFQGLLRLTGWTMYPPAPSQTAYMQLATSLILQTPVSSS